MILLKFARSRAKSLSPGTTIFNGASILFRTSIAPLNSSMVEAAVRSPQWMAMSTGVLAGSVA
jgi:hypothetical protein